MRIMKFKPTNESFNLRLAQAIFLMRLAQAIFLMRLFPRSAIIISPRASKRRPVGEFHPSQAPRHR
jgi:hypothetical protein